MRNALVALMLTYVADRQRRGEITASTAASTRYHLYDFASSWGGRPLNQLGPKATERWLGELAERGLAPATRAVRLSSLRTFARWCVANGHTRTDWTLTAPRIRRPRRVPRDLTRDHFHAILNAAPDHRARLLCWLAFGCGMRCVEMSRLNVDDYDPVGHYLHVVGKALHERNVPAPQPVQHAIAAYLAEQGHRTGPLIRSSDGQRKLGPSRVSHIIRNAVIDAGVKVRNGDGRSAHGLRAAAASDLFDTCGDARTVQEFLGHVNLATTSIYLRRQGHEKVRDANDARFHLHTRPARPRIVAGDTGLYVASEAS